MLAEIIMKKDTDQKLNNYDVPRKIKKSGLTLKNLDNNLIINLYQQGQSATKIAKQLGCSHIFNFKFS